MRSLARRSFLQTLVSAAAVPAVGYSQKKAQEATLDPALDPPPINTHPGPEYDDENRMFQGVPGIERTAKGRLYAVWYGGGSSEDPFNYVMLATSTDQGRSWSRPKLVIDPPGFVHAWDPCLWRDPKGRLWLFWSQCFGRWDGRGGVWAIVTNNPDSDNPKWSKPRRFTDGDMLNKPTVLKSGEWLFPLVIWPGANDLQKTSDKHQLGYSPALIKRLAHDFGADRGRSLVFSSVDEGRTWTRIGHADVPRANDNEPMIVERRDGALWMLTRTMYGIGESVSTDKGRTWTVGRESGIRHPVARFHIRRLRSGNLLLIKLNPPEIEYIVGRSRSHMTAYLSEDDGKTWGGGLLLDERNRVSYPDSTQAEDGTVYAIYDRERTGACEILMAGFTEQDIKAGKSVSGKARLKVIVNKAGAEGR